MVVYFLLDIYILIINIIHIFITKDNVNKIWSNFPENEFEVFAHRGEV